MLEEFIYYSGNNKIFEQKSKQFNANMLGLVRTLHKKDGCYYSNGMTKFIPFDTIDEVKEFEKAHGISFKLCANCFKQGRK